jgi:hypothetical protein
LDRPSARAADSPAASLERTPEGIVDRLAALESSLRALANEVSAAREGIAPAPAAAHHEEREEPSALERRSRTAAAIAAHANAGRSRLRESPLDALFRATAATAGGASAPAEVAPAAPEPREHLRQTAEPPGRDPQAGSDALAPRGRADGGAPCGHQERAPERADRPPASPGGAPAEPWLEPAAAEVEPQLARRLAKREQLFGPEHPDTLWAAHDLASALARAGVVGPARRLAGRLVEERSRLFGPDHPYTMRAYELRHAIAERPPR